jgi:hypothetical protein
MPDPYAQYEIERTQDFNPDTGRSIVILFAAEEAKLNEIADYYEVAGLDNPIGYGFKTTFKKSAAGVFLTVRIPDDILYTESWAFSTVRAQIPIWRDEKVRNYVPSLAAIDLNAPDPTHANFASMMWRIGQISRAANALASGNMDVNVFSTTPPPGFATNLGDFSKEEYDLMLQIIREGPYMDWKFPVLKRRRYIPTVNLAAKTRMVGRDELYTLDGIADTFGIPNDRYDQANAVYTNLPTAAVNTRWTWKLGRNDSEGVVGAAKDVEVIEWTFGMWSTITNTFVV